MAFNVGRAPQGILARALTGNVFVSKSLAFMNEGDKDGYNVYKHDIKNVLEARTDDPFSSVTNTSKKQAYKRTLTVLQSKETFNPSDYYNHWKEYQPAGEFQWEGLPSEVQDVLTDLFLGTAAEAVESELTNGGEITGLIPQLVNPALVDLDGGEATPTQVVDNLAIAFRAFTGGADDNAYAALTTSNIFEKLELLKRKQTKVQRQRANKKFMVNYTTADIMTAAQRLEQVYKGVEVNQEGVMSYAGIPMIINPSLPDNTIILASMGGDMKTDAIQLGTSMSSDFNNLSVNRLNNFNRVWGMILTFALDIFVVRPEEICFYTPETIV